MSLTFGLVGDLCVEAEWIWQRMSCVRHSIDRCQDRLLLARLHNEVNQHVQRCLELRQIHQILDTSTVNGSFQWDLLNELTNRSLLVSSVIVRKII